jgi:serpin B
MSRVIHKPTAKLVVIWASLFLLSCSREEPTLPQGQGSSQAGTPAMPEGEAGAAGKHSSAAAGSSAAGASAAGDKGGTAGRTQPQGGGSAGTAGGAGGSTAPGSDAAIERSSLAADTAPQVAGSDYSAFISQINKFGLDLGQQYVSSNTLAERNVIYSPLSVTVALGMTYAGAKGQTASEMKSTLGDTFAEGVFHTANNRLARELASRITSRPDSDGNSHKIELNLADAIFVDHTITLQQPFLDILSRDYDSGVRRVDFIQDFEPARLSINAWVQEQTKDRIQDLLPQGSVTELTRLVLVNAIYFYGSWSAPFRSSATHDAAFNLLAGSAIQTPTMNGEFRFDYRATDQFAVAELPYEGGKLRMTIVLPAAGQFEALRSQVSAAWLEQAIGGLENTLLRVSLPKFKMTVGSLSLRTGLGALGMNKPFEDDADFSGIALDSKMSLSDVVQKAFIAVDENGTEAAAATGAIAGPTSAPVEQPIPFEVDRPFLYFIRDENGAVLFSGHVVDPSKE